MGTITTWQDLMRPGDAKDFFSRETFPPFDPASGLFNGGNALWLAELSRLVYRRDVEEETAPPLPSRTGFLAKAGLRQRRFFLSKETDTQAMLVEPKGSPAFAVLVFRGTEPKRKDFITDFEVGIKPLASDTSAVHEGFREALDSVWNEIESELSRLSCPVFYTGHSLGAALATLAAARLAPHAVYTFGSPRVGNDAFAATIENLPVHRVVDDEDAVTHLPPELLGFRHAGEVRVLKGPTVNGFYRLLGWFRRRPPKPLADHAPINYVDRIREQITF